MFIIPSLQVGTLKQIQIWIFTCQWLLTMGIMAGSWWAHHELCRGGWWFKRIRDHIAFLVESSASDKKCLAEAKKRLTL
jgi:hypothetical protein